MDPVWDTSEILDNFTYINDWLDQSTVKEHAGPTVPTVAILNDQEDGDCWATPNFNINNTLSEGTPVSYHALQHLQLPPTPAVASNGSLSPYWESSSEFGFESPSVLQNSSSVSNLAIAASSNQSITTNLPAHVSGSSATIDSIDADGFSFPANSTTVQAAPEVETNLGQPTYQILSPGGGNASTPQIVEGIYSVQSGATVASSATQLPAQIPNKGIIWRNSAFAVQSNFVDESSESIVANAPCSKIQVDIESNAESTVKQTNNDASNPGKLAVRISLGKTAQRKKRPPQHKPKLHEVKVPYSDEEKEKKRQNAIKARRNREKLAKEKKELSDEVSNLRKIVRERDVTIEFLKQQREQDRCRVIEFHRSELRRLEGEEWAN